MGLPHGPEPRLGPRQQQLRLPVQQCRSLHPGHDSPGPQVRRRQLHGRGVLDAAESRVLELAGVGGAGPSRVTDCLDHAGPWQSIA